MTTFSKIVGILSLIAMFSCSSSKKNAGNSLSGGQPDVTDGSGLELNGESDSNTAGPLATVYFGFDSATVSDSARAILDANAAFLKANEGIQVQVEGHCDERGSIQYNLALGERRAKAVKDYLVSSGVDGSRVSTISYGKEKPVDLGHDEAAWARNRRGNFVITAK